MTTLLEALYAGARALKPTDRARVAKEFLPLPPSKSETDVTTLRLPRKPLRLVHAWIEIHRDELAANWDLATSGENPYKIDPL